MEDIKSVPWEDYELIDVGDFEKLERFGKFLFRRPEPQAFWQKRLPDSEWMKLADATFIQKNSNSGEWKFKKPIPETWNIKFKNNVGLHISFKLKFTAFKHLGVFPEQASNWIYIYEVIQKMKKTIPSPKFLNLFAYTGGATLAAKQAGADAFHLDSIKQVVGWAKENMELSHLKDIRWVVEDALNFVRREVKRGNKYHFIIMDPPAYGLGPKGERWKLEENINELINLGLQLLDDKSFGFIINTYSLNLSSIILKNFLTKPNHLTSVKYGEVYTPAKSGVDLPLGAYLRFNSELIQ